MNDMIIHSKIRDYTVRFHDSFGFMSESFNELNPKVVIIDKNIVSIYKEIVLNAFGDDIILFDALEENKTLEQVASLYSLLIDKNAKRNLNLISIGGGITQDVTGFIASTLYRGLNWTFIPTTFLAQTDSCIGSKTSINFKSNKNLLGTFYPPSNIHICPLFLSSLSDIDYKSGIGELIKFQLMNPFIKPDFESIEKKINNVINFRSLESVIRENMSIKIDYMNDDEFDLGKRNLLNYGHCFGHALETSSNYKIPHGIAVSIGIIFAGIVSVKRGIMNKSFFNNMVNRIILPYIPLKYNANLYDEKIILSALKNDKKRTGSKLSIILSDDKFMLKKYDDLNEAEFYESLETLKLILNN